LLVRSFVDVRSSILSIGDRGMLSNAVHPCWIVQVPSRGVVVSVAKNNPIRNNNEYRIIWILFKFNSNIVFFP